MAAPDAAVGTLPSPGMLAQSLGVALQPYLEGTQDRMVVAPGGEAAETVVKLVADSV